MSSLLAIYVQDHHAAGLAGARVARRVAMAVERDSGNAELRRVASEISEDLLAFSRITERFARLKLNGRLLRRSPLSDLLELETLVVGITGKQALWVSLREIPSIQIEELDQLLERAEEQKRSVENARVAAARRSFQSAHTREPRL